MSDAKEAMIFAREAIRDNLSMYQYKNEPLLLEAFNKLEAAIAQHPADDEEALSGEWLKGQGFDVGTLNDIEWYAELRGVVVVMLHEDGTCILGDYNPDGGIDWPVKITTRGQLRDLLKVLGIKN